MDNVTFCSCMQVGTSHHPAEQDQGVLGSFSASAWAHTRYLYLCCSHALILIGRLVVTSIEHAAAVHAASLAPTDSCDQ
jgi:hypothetical protein